MHFLIDNALSPKLADGLRGRGLAATHVREIGLHQAADSVIFDYAASQQQVIISADTDFSAILAQRNAAKPSVILFRASSKQTVYLLDLLLLHLDRFQQELKSGCVLVFDDRRVRIRLLPILKRE